MSRAARPLGGQRLVSTARKKLLIYRQFDGETAIKNGLLSLSGVNCYADRIDANKKICPPGIAGL